MMLPPEFLERIERQAYIDASGLAEALGGPSAASVRVNRFKWPHRVSGYDRVEWEPDGFYLPGRPLYTSDPLFHAGVYYPQESSGMFTGEMFRQVTAGQEGLRVLDLCGAPGGKSTHLASILGDDGLLVANEVIRSRSAILAENITKWGTGNVIVTNADPSRFAQLPGFFDVVVADVPCSGEGMFRSTVAVREWSLQNANLCCERQRRIIMEVWPAIKPGGILIYSTCTFNPAENEENVEWIRKGTGAEPVMINLPPGSPVVPVRYGGTEGYGFYPGRVRGEGFFIAAIRKPVTPAQDERAPDGRKSAVKPSPEAFEKTISLAAFDRERVVMHEGRIIALAADAGLFGFIEARLPVIKAGTMIGELKKNELIPAHDLSMSARQRQEAWTRHSLSREEALAFLRLEALNGSAMPEGRVLLTYRDVPLGFVKNLGNRVNNSYPRLWRIRMERETVMTEIL
ncbi:MAG TPA: rRNA cytosine-C5-methyltransferase [Bacteroidales bacterium]|nr:rRNA cytosine-C5-methyltransferase [Bacteroidales bacterium]